MTGLTALQVRNAKPGRYADGRGLYLLVRPSGSRAWVLRTQVDGKRRARGLGSTETLSLAQARAKAADLRTRIDRKSVVWGKRVAVRVDLGGRRSTENKKRTYKTNTYRK